MEASFLPENHNVSILLIFQATFLHGADGGMSRAFNLQRARTVGRRGHAARLRATRPRRRALSRTSQTDCQSGWFWLLKY